MGAALAACGVAVAALVVSLHASTAWADAPADNRRAAAELYDKGAAAYARKDYASAADWFEAADRESPDSLALGEAIRALRLAGSPASLARAATLALRLKARHPTDAASAQLAREVETSLAPMLTRVTVTCGACDLLVDGAVETSRELFLAPGDHRFVAQERGKPERTRLLDARAGRSETVDLTESALPGSSFPGNVSPGAGGSPAGTAPTSSTPATSPVTAPTNASSRTPSFAASGNGTSAPADSSDARSLSPAFAWTGVGLTAALGTAAAVSWFADAVPQANKLMREAQATHTRDASLEDSVHGAEVRSTVLFAGAAVVGVATLVTATFFTRWGDRAQVGVAPTPNGARFVGAASF